VHEPNNVCLRFTSKVTVVTGLAVVTFLVGPNEARVRVHSRYVPKISIVSNLVAKHQTILPPNANTISQESRVSPYDFGTHHP